MRLLTSFFLCCIAITGLSAQDAPSLRVMSFNIRYATPNDGYNAWSERKELAASMIRYHEADMVGLQEALHSQLDDLTGSLSGYAWTGVSRQDGAAGPDAEGEFSAILYREARLELLESSTFWLSEQPEEVGSQSWDAALPRIVTWARFRDKESGEEFYHFNTHFDHIGVEAREESAELIVRRIAARDQDLPVVLTGDFNCVPTDDPYRVLTAAGSGLQDAQLHSAEPHHGPDGTWSGFSFPGQPGRRIDYVFFTEGFTVQKHATLSESWSGRFPSDHLPVLAQIVPAP